MQDDDVFEDALIIPPHLDKLELINQMIDQHLHNFYDTATQHFQMSSYYSFIRHPRMPPQQAMYAFQIMIPILILPSNSKRFCNLNYQEMITFLRGYSSFKDKMETFDVLQLHHEKFATVFSNLGERVSLSRIKIASSFAYLCARWVMCVLRIWSLLLHKEKIGRIEQHSKQMENV